MFFVCGAKVMLFDEILLVFERNYEKLWEISFFSLMWLYGGGMMQIVGKKQKLLTFCKNNWSFCLQFKQKVLSLYAKA